MNTYVSIANKLNDGLVALYSDTNKYATELNITYLVVGAMARDLVLVHGISSWLWFKNNGLLPIPLISQ